MAIAPLLRCLTVVVVLVRQLTIVTAVLNFGPFSVFCISLYCIALYWTGLYFLYWSVLYCIALHCILLYWIVLFQSAESFTQKDITSQTDQFLVSLQEGMYVFEEKITISQFD